MSALRLYCLVVFFSFSVPAFSQDAKKETPGQKPKPEKKAEKPAVAEKKEAPAKKAAAPAKKKAAAEKKSEPAKDDAPAKADKPAAKKPSVPAEKKEDSKPEPKLHKVATKDMVIELDLSGVVEAENATPIALRPKAWGDLSVVSAVEHGTKVEKGEIILQLETEKIEKAIRDQKAAMPIAELTLKATERELEVSEKTTPMSLEDSRRSKMEAEADLAYFEDVTLPMRKRDEKEDLKYYESSVAYAEEELKQLKKMYENDDVTEETEEIILERAQNSVDRSRWMLEQARTRMERSLNTSIPREHDSMKRSMEKRQITWRTGEQSMREGLEKKRLETAQARRAHEKSVEKLEEMEKDLKILTVRAPHDGVVYYGAAQRGRWTTASSVERKLIPGGKLMPHEVVMTVVDPGKVRLRVAVAEDKLKDLKKGQKGEAKLKWNDEVKLNATVHSVSYIPQSNNTFDSVISLAKGKQTAAIYPGMNATAKIKVYEKKDAVVVPKAAIKTEDEKKFVTLKGGKKIEVKTGRSDKDSTEILSGLKKDDEIEFGSAPAKKEEEKKSDSAADKSKAPAPKKS